MTNAKVLWDAFDWIKANPKRWNQNVWVSSISAEEGCDTAMCIAGVIVTQSGREVSCMDQISSLARHCAKLTEEEGKYLFYTSNWINPPVGMDPTLEELKQAIEDIVGPRASEG